MILNSPYKGLMPYDEGDASFFFGREAEKEIITANLLASRLTLLYGPSGVGKSSVLRAGVAHHLRELAQQNRVERGASEFAVVVFSNWRDDPMAGLLAAVETAATNLQSRPSSAEDSVRAGALGDAVAATFSRQISLTQTLQLQSEHIDGDLLIILDQFEEYFLYHPTEDGEGTFAVEFPRAVSRSDLRVSFLISVREDALAKLDRFKGRIPNLFANYLRIDHLDRDAARAAIVKPIEQHNRGNGAQVSIEPALVDVVLDQVKTGQVTLGEAGRGVVASEHADARIETPYLQLVMTRLWEEEVAPTPSTTLRTGLTLPRDEKRIAGEGVVLRLETLNRLGGAERIVRTHLDNTMSALPSDERDAAARIFHYLVTPSGSKIAHAVPDLAEYAQVSQSQVTPMLEKLSGSGIRILRPVAPPLDQVNAPPRYEIFHDVLAPAILDWRARYVQAQELAEAEKRRVETEQRMAQERAEAEKKLAQARRRANNLRLGMIGSTLLLVVMIGLAVFAFSQRTAAENARVQVVEQRDVAQRAQADAIAQRDAAEKAKADAEFQRQIAFARELSGAATNNIDVDPERSILLVLQAISVSTAGGKPVLPEAEGALHRAVISSRVLLTMRGHTLGIRGIAISPDGQRIATGSEDSTAKIWDVATGKELLTLTGHTGNVRGVAFSPDGRRLVTGSGDKTAKMWDTTTGKELLTFAGHSGPVSGVAISPDGTRIATASGITGSDNIDHTAKVWDAATGKELLTLIGHTNGVNVVAFSPDGRRLATGSEDNTAKIWDAATGKELLTLTGHTQYIARIAFSPDGKRLATGSLDKTAKIWDTTSGQLVITIFAHGSTVTGVAFDPAGSRLVTTSLDGIAKIWDAATGQLLMTVVGHNNAVRNAVFSPDGTRLVTSAGDATVKVWDVSPAGGSEWLTLTNHKGGIFSAAYSADGLRIATASADHTAKIWDAVTGKELLTLCCHADELRDIVFTPDGSRLVTNGNDQTIKVWDATTGKELLTIPTQSYRFVQNNHFAISPDGRRIAAPGPGDIGIRTGAGVAKIWDITSGKELLTLSGHRGAVLGVAFSPDGKRVATASGDGTAKVWNAETGKELLTLEGGSGSASVNDVSFSPDGRRIATNLGGSTVNVRDAASGQVLLTLSGLVGVRSVIFSPDGTRLATSGSDGLTKVWDVSSASGRSDPLLTLYGHDGIVNRAVFSPDGKRLVTAGGDGTARVWVLPLEDIVAIAKSRVTRALTTDECQKFLHVEQCP